MDEDGSVQGVVLVFRDVTEEYAMQQAVKESEEKHRTLFETANDAILLADIETGTILDANQKAGELFGMPSSELIGLHHTQLHPEELAETYREGFKEHVPKEGSVMGDMSISRKDGAVIPVELSEGVIELKGRKVRLGIFREVTDRKEAEEALMESEQRFRGAFENAAVGASMVDLKGRFLKVNRRLCELLGYPENELLSKTFSDITHPEDIQIGLDNLKRQISGEADYTSFEKRYVRKDGEVIHVIVSPALIRNSEGTPQHFVGLWQDITERKRAEEQILRSLEEKEVLLKEIHHRVKNNMNVITSLLSLQSRYIRDKDALRIFRDGQNRIRAMARVHEKLYQSEDFSKVNINDYIEVLAKDLFNAYHISESSVSLKVNAGDVFLDIDFLIPCGLIINEIVSNSLKHGFREGRKGEISISLTSDASGKRLVVSDNGIGMPEGFDIDKSETLGLLLVNSLVSQLRGTMEIDSNEGTTYQITFPELDGPA
jgi:PAS domain S-box-containing protein